VHPEPYVFWHPVPQYAVVLPHQPEAEQQLPKVLPAQVNLLVPPQVPSVETVPPVVVVVHPLPKPDWHPVPQYAVVLPHHPEAEQQLPKVLPAHVYFLVPPQVPSGLTEEVGLVVVVHPLPKPDWHPVPQYALVLPHHPAAEQQLPKALPAQVKPLVPPHEPSVDVGLAPVAVVVVEALVVVVEALVVAEPAPVVETPIHVWVASEAGGEVFKVKVPEDVKVPPPSVRYQLAFGSPRQSPTVTGL
jgi:hypothetical protein